MPAGRDLSEPDHANEPRDPRSRRPRRHLDVETTLRLRRGRYMRGKLATRTRQDIRFASISPTTPRRFDRSPRPPTWKPRTTRARNVNHRPRALSHRRVLARRQAAARRIRDRRFSSPPLARHSAARRTHSSIRSASWKRRSCACRLRWPWIPSPATLARPPAFQVRRAQHGAGAEHPLRARGVRRLGGARKHGEVLAGRRRHPPTRRLRSARDDVLHDDVSWFKTGGGVVSLVLMGAGVSGRPRAGHAGHLARHAAAPVQEAGASLPGARAPRPRSARLRWQTSRRESRDWSVRAGGRISRGAGAGPTRQVTDGRSMVLRSVECRDCRRPKSLFFAVADQ